MKQTERSNKSTDTLQHQDDQHLTHNSAALEWLTLNWRMVALVGGLTIAGGSGVVLLLWLANVIDDLGQALNFVAQNTLSLFIFLAVIVQAVISNKQWVAMRDSVERTDTIIGNMQGQLASIEGQERIMQAQLETMKEQTVTAQVVADAATESARVARLQVKFMARSESAYLSVGDLVIPPIRNNQLVVGGKIFNRGKTPAYDFRRQIQIAIGKGTPPVGWGRFEWTFSPEECESLEIAAGDSVNFTTEPLKIDSAILGEINEGKQTIVIDGQCRYHDNMGDLLIYRFGLAAEIDPPRGHIRYQEHRREETDADNPN
jgi:hypothetical protein